MSDSPVRGAQGVLIASLQSASGLLLALMMLVLLTAGFVKGAIGVGMPVVGFPLLTSLLDVEPSVMILTVPLILSNVPQALEGGAVVTCLCELLPVMAGMVPGLALGVLLLAHADPAHSKVLAGAVVVIVALLMLAGPRVRIAPAAQRSAGLLTGFFGGVLGGLAAMPGPLVFTFLLAKGLRGQVFTKQASMFLVLAAGLMALMLAATRKFELIDIAISTLATVPIAAGMYFGQRVRDVVPADAFKTVILAVVFFSGLQLMSKGMFY